MSDRKILVDRFGRRVTTLRISLTDRCNFRCVYCLPPEGLPALEKSNFLSVNDITRLVGVFGRLGVTRFRLTGGEPLLRTDIVQIVRSLKQVDGVRDLSITTNGSRLMELAHPLKAAGLDRLNISLDSLDADRFGDIAGTEQFGKVRAGIGLALRAGFPVKLNMVLLRGISIEEILQFVTLAVNHPLDVRFLEFMPLCGSGWNADLVYPVTEVFDIVRQHFHLQERPRNGDPAKTYSIAGGMGGVGFIAPLSEPFCDHCSRIRITADGKLRPCLFSDYEMAIGDLIKGEEPDDALIEAVRRAVWDKPRGSDFNHMPFRGETARSRSVSPGPFIRSIGG
jgi:cyclic pyranopterin phosphate synthase